MSDGLVDNEIMSICHYGVPSTNGGYIEVEIKDMNFHSRLLDLAQSMDMSIEECVCDILTSKVDEHAPPKEVTYAG